MDLETLSRPMGRHKITVPQLRAEAAGAAAFTPTTPGQALAAFKRAEPALGIPAQVVKLVDYLVGRTRSQDWDGGPGLGPIAWPSDAELEDRLNVGPSQRKAVVRAALEAGVTLQLTVRLAPFVTATALNRETRTPSNIRFAAILISGWNRARLPEARRGTG